MVPYNEWTEVDSKREGNFLERFAPGSLSKALKERGSRIRALFQHGMDSLIGRQPIADIEEMWEREDGAHFRSRLLEGVPELIVSGLRRGLYGSSISFRASKFERVSHPRRSAHNPDGVEERTITEAGIYEFSLVTFPQYQGATARVEVNDA
jgi:HK97 family phage prohead protease